MFLFQLLRYLKGPYEVVGTFVLPALFFAVLFFWPFLDRGPHRDPRRRPVAISLLTVATVCLVGLTIYAGMTDVRMHEPVAAAPAPPAQPAVEAGPIQKLEVASLYNKECASCHGISGTGAAIRPAMKTIPDFTSLAWQMSQTDLAISHQILEGAAPLMPAYKDKLTHSQVLALAIYVRAFAIEPSIEPKPPAVAAGGVETRPAETQAAAAPIAARMAPSKSTKRIAWPVMARMVADRSFVKRCPLFRTSRARPGNRRDRQANCACRS